MRCRNDPMFSLLKGMALFVAVTCVVWVAVLWNWETSNRNMTTGDIVVQTKGFAGAECQPGENAGAHAPGA